MTGPRPQYRRLGLEMSLKPFPSFNEVDVRATAEVVFDQWRLLGSRAEEATVLLWIADGSELLEWAGDLDQPMQWGSLVGFANTQWDPYGQHDAGPTRHGKPYRDQIPTLNYAELRRIVAILREVGERKLGLPVTIGATFDPGPEFADSEFKYVRHREILAAGEDLGLGPLIAMLQADSRLRGDDRRYAAYPDGIPDGLSFGTFLGQQAESYLAALGFDYLWLSNGFGFSSFPWAPVGVGFDGLAFHPERLGASRTGLQGFWRDLLAGTTFPVEVRGTNFTTGMDLGSDGTPAAEILATGRVRNPPPNSPWGPLNHDFGIELTGYLSRIVRPPSGDFLFRFYANDPWFWQNPWWDFYRRDPFDIHLPLSVSRLTGDGSPQPARDLQILSIDTAAGVLDERVGREVGDRVLEALETPPDAAGPFVWLYPYGQYHADAAEDPATGASAYFEDELITAAVNAGLPLNTVLDTSDLTTVLPSGALRGRVVVAPTRVFDADALHLLDELTAAGADVLLYGAVDRGGPGLAAALGLGLAEPVEGEAILVGRLGAPLPLRHPAILSGGGVREQATTGVELASLICGGEARSYAVAVPARQAGGGRVVWVRGSASTAGYAVDNHGLRSAVPLDPATAAVPAAVLLAAVGEFDYDLGSVRDQAGQPAIVQTVHRSDGAWWFNGYLADTTVRGRWRFPYGAPLLHQRDCVIDDGRATYQFGRSFHLECRLFAVQQQGRVSVRELAPFPYGIKRYFEVRGLDDAVVTVFPPPSALARAELEVNGQPVEGNRDAETGTIALPVTGTLRVRW